MIAIVNVKITTMFIKTIHNQFLQYLRMDMVSNQIDKLLLL